MPQVRFERRLHRHPNARFEPPEVRDCFKTALENVKPTDALIVGMYQQFGDQVGENAALVRELGRRTGE